jgi:hypothetical protein
MPHVGPQPQRNSGMICIVPRKKKGKNIINEKTHGAQRIEWEPGSQAAEIATRIQNWWDCDGNSLSHTHTLPPIAPGLSYIGSFLVHCSSSPTSNLSENEAS